MDPKEVIDRGAMVIRGVVDAIGKWLMNFSMFAKRKKCFRNDMPSIIYLMSRARYDHSIRVRAPAPVLIPGEHFSSRSGHVGARDLNRTSLRKVSVIGKSCQTYGKGKQCLASTVLIGQCNISRLLQYHTMRPEGPLRRTYFLVDSRV